jgi:chemotaxis protein CheY-P-specific phosphatase CheC
MTAAHDDAIRQVAEEMFETLAFMFPIPPDEAMPDDQPLRRVQVDFDGYFPGRLYLGVSAAMLAPLATNMLGMDDFGSEPSEAQQADALKELINVLCGNILPAIAGSDPVFNVHAPQQVEGDGRPAAPEGCQQLSQVRVELDSGAAELTLFVRQDAPVPSA